MKLWVKEFLQHRGIYLHTARSLPPGVDWLLDVRRHSGLSRNAAPVCLDVGANIGQTVIEITDVFPSARIHAFEPFSEPLAQLRQVAAARPSVCVVPVALGSVAGETMVEPRERSVLNSLRGATVASDSAPLAGPGTEKIVVRTLDEYCEAERISSVDILKTDTEGYDAEVLKGAKTLLERRAVRYVFAEVTFLPSNPNNTKFQDVWSILAANGYRLLGLYETFSMHNFPEPNHFCNALFSSQQPASGGGS